MDLVLRNAAIVDGTGRPAVHGDVAIAKGRVVALGAVEGKGGDEIDVRGAVVVPLERRREAFGDTQVRERLSAGLEEVPRGALAEAFKHVSDYTVEGATLAHNRQWIGQTVGAYAQAVGKAPFAAFLDLSIEEGLRLAFTTKTNKDDPESWRLRAAAWQDERCIVGGSDAGAHLDMLNSFAFATEFFNQGVRQRNLLRIEEAVRLITSVPAERFGLTGRGRLEEGACADIVVFDPDRIVPN
jgi:N-acyl-D-aspartate/D-glutamate deacylase